MGYCGHVYCIFLGIPTELHFLLVVNQEGGQQFEAWVREETRQPDSSCRRKLTNRRCRVSLSRSVKVDKGRIKVL